MPIIPTRLDDLSAVTQVAETTPLFFSSKLTGSGGRTGILNRMLRPRATGDVKWWTINPRVARTRTADKVTTTVIPVGAGVVPTTARNDQPVGMTLTPVPLPNPAEAFWFERQDGFAALDMIPACVVIREDRSAGPLERAVEVLYQVNLFTSDVRGTFTPNGTRLLLGYASDPAGGQLDIVRGWASTVNPVPGALDDLGTWMAEYPVHARIDRLAKAWNSAEIGEFTAEWVRRVRPADDDQCHELARQLRYLENHKVPLEAYRVIHEALSDVFASRPEMLSALVRENLNLLLSHMLSELDGMHDQLVRPPAANGSYTPPVFLSGEQRAAVTSREPLIMTQAGAGTGKSTVIRERIGFLESCGVKPQGITVLSFTNAAADHISEIAPGVGSMTIARMIIGIYELNHPNHRLSTVDSLSNALRIFAPYDKVGARLINLLTTVDQSRPGAMTSLNAFVEVHFDEVMALLDLVGQTTLELQIIICYQRIDEMTEPPEISSRFLIIDEVQDTSVFEFVYLIKYTAKHAESLFIVGDASQTLYEFRAANPRALNTLEASGVFRTYQLTTNYRSNQEILDFANVALLGLETNRFANIQLQADSLALPTQASFSERVTVDWQPSGTIREFTNDILPGLLTDKVCQQWVRPRLDRGEQTIFLAYSRKEIDLVTKALGQAFPDEEVVSLISERAWSTDVFSTFVRKYWNTVLQVTPANAAFTISKGIQDNLPQLARNGQRRDVYTAVVNLVSRWWIDSQPRIDGWVRMVQHGVIDQDEFFRRLRDDLLKFEIAHNQAKLNLVKQRNQERKASQDVSRARLLVSTIHGVKGLEFDNVVLLAKENGALDQDMRRLYYVALTRAIRSEYVIVYGKNRTSEMYDAHQQIMAALADRDAAHARVPVP